MSKVIGYTLNGEALHPQCFQEMYGASPEGYVNERGEEPGAMFDTDEHHPLGESCGLCLDYIAEPYWRKYDGSSDWPDWSGVDECLCGRPLTEDAIPNPCPDCGREPWELLADDCEGCHKPVNPDSTYWLSDWGDVRHLNCEPTL